MKYYLQVPLQPVKNALGLVKKGDPTQLLDRAVEEAILNQIEALTLGARQKVRFTAPEESVLPARYKRDIPTAKELRSYLNQVYGPKNAIPVAVKAGIRPGGYICLSLAGLTYKSAPGGVEFRLTVKEALG